MSVVIVLVGAALMLLMMRAALMRRRRIARGLPVHGPWRWPDRLRRRSRGKGPATPRRG
ncbi:hypothetical protein [Cryobacterium sp. MLB-32]|uniref:hypothetical protein n=1 Tax=Cryobacterium sp. MLB-32 TaxID=1529318 RepID=UPI0012E0A5CF|nr:hypothetical protein [Cryobacterium sp. MLB-32]